MADGSLYEIMAPLDTDGHRMAAALRVALGRLFKVQESGSGFEVMLRGGDPRPFEGKIITANLYANHEPNKIDRILYFQDFIVTGLIRIYVYQGPDISQTIEFNQKDGVFLVNGKPLEKKVVLEFFQNIRHLFASDPSFEALMVSITPPEASLGSIPTKPTVDQIHSFDQLRGFDPEILNDAIRHSLSEQLGRKPLPSVKNNEAPIPVVFSYNANENALSVFAETAGFCVTLHLLSGIYTHAEKQIDREDLLDIIANLPINAADSLDQFLLLTDEARDHFFQLISTYIQNQSPNPSGHKVLSVVTPPDPGDSLLMRVYSEGGRLVSGMRAAAAALLVALSSRAA